MASQLGDDTPLTPEILGVTGPANAAQHDADLNTIAAMQQWGGHFVRQLAELALRCDYYNLQKLKAAWPEHWHRYEEMHAHRDQIASLQTRMAQASGENVIYCRHNHKHYDKADALACDEHHKAWGS